MKKPLKILIISPEVAPFAKTGGMADVTGALPKKLKKLGHDVRVFMPYYDVIQNSKIKTRNICSNLEVNIADRVEKGSILETNIDGDIPVYLLHKDRYYKRPHMYGTPEGDYEDNSERFIYFSRASLEALKAIDFCPDVIHCNDWQTGLVPLYLKSLYKDDPFFAKTVSIFSIHNLAYQGLFWHFDMPLTGLPWSYFTSEGIEFFGKINLLKAGIMYADKVNTVSKGYAKEIKSTEYGCGLEGVLASRDKDFEGILNGVDYDIFNPETDKDIAAGYSAKNVRGKAECKKELQELCGLPIDPEIPVIGLISRLADQKGFDLIAEQIDEMMKLKLQFVLLGTGDKVYHALFEKIAEQYPEKTGIFIKYDAKLAQKIYAGSDMFLMPSRYEPCGLGQLISLRYGTVPIVRKTGGLADTITAFSPKSGKGNGFSFNNYTSKNMLIAINKALNTYKDKAVWKKLVNKCMKEDFSWTKSAKEYVKLYKKGMNAK